MNDTDLQAAKRLLNDIRDRLEILQCDVISFYRALDGPAGTVHALADEMLDRNPAAPSS
jgi:hypothetical protein